MQPEVKNHWLSHTNENDMRTKVAITVEAMEKTVKVIAASEQWDPEITQRSLLALTRSLIIGGLTVKKETWQEMIKMTGNYNISKIQLVRSKLKTIDYLKQQSLK